MIKAEHLVKNFDAFCALNDISCTINDGCIYGMVGSNGAGKSTFLRVITGIYKADEGEVTIDGVSMWENPAVKKRIGYVPDELYFLPGASMERMAVMYNSIYPNFDKSRFSSLAKQFGLNTKQQISTFSKGMSTATSDRSAAETMPGIFSRRRPSA